MADTLAKDLIARQERMQGKRGTFEQHWQDIAELINPMRAEFTQIRTLGEKRTQRIFDGTAGMAQENLGAGLYGLMTSPANTWFEIESEEDDLNQIYAVQVWCSEVSRRMRNAFAANGNRFYTRVIDLYADNVGFGTGVFYAEEMVARGQIFFSCRHLAECYIAESQHEEVDTLFRKFKWTARQANQKWHGNVGERIKAALERDPEREFPFLHAVLPAEELNDRSITGHRAFASVYVDLESRKLLSRAGYFEFPYQVPRWSTRSRNVYGDGPGMLALADTKMVNQMSRTTLTAAQKVVDPPLLAPDEHAGNKGIARGLAR